MASNIYKTAKSERKAAEARTKLRREGKLPPPPHVMPKVKRHNGGPWKYVPVKERRWTPRK